MRNCEDALVGGEMSLIEFTPKNDLRPFTPGVSEGEFCRQNYTLRVSWINELFNPVTSAHRGGSSLHCSELVASGYQVQTGPLSSVMDEQMTATAREMTHRIIRLFMLCCTLVLFATHS